jgi:hypothetical protein
VLGKTPYEGKTFDDFVTFGRLMIASRDLDPLYDVLVSLYEAKGLNEERRLWFTALYLAYYNLPSAAAAFYVVPSLRHFEEYAMHDSVVSEVIKGYPTGIERRGLRGGKVIDHLRDYARQVKVIGTQLGWLATAFRPHSTPEENYEDFWNLAQVPWGNGRWAAYKWAELLKTVHRYPLAAPDLRLPFCSGPKEGLCWLFGEEKNAPVEHLNMLAEALKLRLEVAGLHVSWEELETLLCNFNSMRKGKYYVGHDIDELQVRLYQANAWFPEPSELQWLWKAREDALPREYLGEMNNIMTPEAIRERMHNLKPYYRASGQLFGQERVRVRVKALA